MDNALMNWQTASALCILLADPAGSETILENLGVYEARDYVSISAAYNPQVCGSEYPILVEVKNDYNEDIEFIGFKLIGREIDRSTMIYFELWNYESDRIVGAGEEVRECWAVPVGLLSDFCKPTPYSCDNDGPERDAALRAKFQRFELNSMRWSVRLEAVRFSG